MILFLFFFLLRSFFPRHHEESTQSQFGNDRRTNEVRFRDIYPERRRISANDPPGMPQDREARSRDTIIVFGSRIMPQLTSFARHSE